MKYGPAKVRRRTTELLTPAICTFSAAFEMHAPTPVGDIRILRLPARARARMPSVSVHHRTPENVMTYHFFRHVPSS